MRAVIMAGGINRRKLYPGYRPGLKALLEIGGRPLLAYVLDALEPVVDEIGLVGDHVALRPIAGDRPYIDGGVDLLDSFKNALKLFRDDERILIATCDLPMLKSHMVEQFLAVAATRPEADLHLAMVPHERFYPPFTRIKKNFNVFADGAVCHGNLVLVRPDILDNTPATSVVNRIYRSRLSPIKSALTLGLGLGLTYVFGVHVFHKVRLEEFAQQLSRRFHLKMAPVICTYPEVAVDVDEEADYRIACEVLER